MAREVINTGSAPNDPTADTVLAAFTKTNTMMTELYGLAVLGTPTLITLTGTIRAAFLLVDSNFASLYAAANPPSARPDINEGSALDDPTAESLFSAFTKINTMTQAIYDALQAAQAVWGPTPSITVPSGAIMLTAGQGSAQLQSLINANAGATTFGITAGTHVWTAAVTPKTGNIFIGEYGAILDGQNSAPYCFRVVSAGTVSNVTIKNLEVINFTTPTAWQGAITVDSNTGWVIQHNAVHHNADTGIHVGGGAHTVSGNSVTLNGKSGIQGYQCTGSVFDGNDVSGNNSSQLYLDPSVAGESGMKIFQAGNVTISNNQANNNYGKGIWSDTNYPTFQIFGNTCNNNRGAGIFHEVSYAAVIYNNHCENNGHTETAGGLTRGGIQVSNCPNVEVYGNTLIDNWHGIACAYFTGYATTGPYGALYLENLNVHHNSVQMTRVNSHTGIGSNYGDPALWTSHNNHFEDNTYFVPTPTTNWFEWNNVWMTFTTWKNTYGNDDGGSINLSS